MLYKNDVYNLTFITKKIIVYYYKNYIINSKQSFKFLETLDKKILIRVVFKKKIKHKITVPLVATIVINYLKRY